MPKIWLLTSCSSGLGERIAKLVLHCGALTAVTARNPSGLQPLAEKYPNQILPVCLDLNDYARL